MKNKAAAGAFFKGYEALRTTTGTWTDYNGSKRPIEIFRTEIRTPYSLGIDVENLNNRLKKDLSGIWEDISILDKKECNKRAYMRDMGGFIYDLIGCTATKDWQQDRWLITIITRNDFEGFPEN